MFLGEYQKKIDTRGRIVLPARWVQAIGSEPIVLAPGLDGCVFIFTESAWKEPAGLLEHSMEELSAGSGLEEMLDILGLEETNWLASLKRFPVHRAKCEADGRLRIPAHLRHYAFLEGAVAVVGAVSRIELWNAALWAQVLQEVELNAEQIAGLFEAAVLELPTPHIEVVDEWRYLARRIAQDPKILYDLDWRRFEDLVASLLESYGWQVEPMGYTKDGGIDILAVRKIAPAVDCRMMVQCKRMARHRKVGIDVVREVWAIKWQHALHQAMIATTSAFTSGARTQAQEWNVALKDHDAIVGWCREHGTSVLLPSGLLHV